MDRYYFIDIVATPTGNIVTFALPDDEVYARGNVTIQGFKEPGATGDPVVAISGDQFGNPSSWAGGSAEFSDGLLTVQGVEINNNGLLSVDTAYFAPDSTYSGAGLLYATNGVTFDGLVKPGNSPGNMQIQGNVTLGPDAIPELEIGFYSFDQLTVYGGTLDIQGATLALVFTEGWDTLGTVWGSLLNTPFTGGFGAFTIQGLADPAEVTIAELNAKLPSGWYQPVPEPRVYALLAGLLALGAALHRRRRH